MPMRSFHGAPDCRAMIELALENRELNLHVADLPYRLASWALDDPENVALWFGSTGLLTGWAVLQSPFWSIDVVARPEAAASVFPQALDWAGRRAEAVRGTAHGRPSWYVHVFADQKERLRDLEAAGFACQADVGEDSWSRVLLSRTGSPPSVATPSGFVVRPLRGPAETDAYVELHQAAFESKNMTGPWRRRTLGAAHHVREADLVARAADGKLAGFCIGWLAPNGLGQIEPLGIRREYRERGLGAALLARCVQALASHGAREVLVETDTYRAPALGLYEAVGFTPVRDVLVYRRDVTV